jgi:hypothetical protein
VFHLNSQELDGRATMSSLLPSALNKAGLQGEQFIDASITRTHTYTCVSARGHMDRQRFINKRFILCPDNYDSHVVMWQRANQSVDLFVIDIRKVLLHFGRVVDEA